jgi:methyl-accepting chemotaxis protein
MSRDGLNRPRLAALVTLPPVDGEVAAHATRTARPERRQKKRVGLTRWSIRTQGAALFALLTILVSGVLTGIAVAVQDSNANQNSVDALLTWQYQAAQIDALSQAIIRDTIWWNNAMLAKDPSAIRGQHLLIDAEISSVQALDAKISALPLPSDTRAIRATYSDGIATLVGITTRFLAAGIHSDADTLAVAVASITAWQETSTLVRPFITSEVDADLAAQTDRRAYISNLLVGGGILATLMIVLLALVLFQLTLRPITHLARVATTLAHGRSATITPTNRRDEIGQLTSALATWQESLTGVLGKLRGDAADSSRRLAAVAGELASVTSSQTAVATATSANMERLEFSSASIADTIDRAAIKADQTRESLALAQIGFRESGNRTIALAARVNEVQGILNVINEIADQTNLLALNAAIEAARAGDSGRGFAVVADEVRRLAERTKTAAGDIAKLVQGAQAQSGETVLALDKGVQQMERGLVMMKEMAELSTQVQLSTQQQRSATAEVMEAIEHIAEGSRSVAATAQEMAAAAASQGDLESDLTGHDRSASEEELAQGLEELRRPA